MVKKKVPRDGREGRPEGKMAKKKLPRPENFRSKNILYSNWYAFLSSAVITLDDLHIFSESMLYTTMSISSAWGIKDEVMCPCLGQRAVRTVKKSWKIQIVGRLLRSSEQWPPRMSSPNSKNLCTCHLHGNGEVRSLTNREGDCLRLFKMGPTWSQRFLKVEETKEEVTVIQCK